MATFFYYLLIKPLSLLPLRILFIGSNIIYFFIYRITGYRKEIVFTNLRNSFTELTEKEIEQLAKKFYKHLADLMVESLKLNSITKKDALARCKVINPDILDNIYSQGKHAVVIGGHYNNWEMLAVSLDMQIKHRAVGIYTPLTNKFMDRKINTSRSRFGLELVSKYISKEYLASEHEELKAIVFGADQSPHKSSKRFYWAKFLNQDTAVQFGAEKYSVEKNYPVVFFYMTKVKRGYYEVRFELMESNPKDTEYGTITEKHVRLLEKQILDQPEYYLWTHKRWKIKKTEESSSPASN
ncbi:MAG: lysophospholipid acyltransferase family protein [Bacteroidota bacterium]